MMTRPGRGMARGAGGRPRAGGRRRNYDSLAADAPGSAMAGHYFAYIKELSSGTWYKFNDRT